MSDDVYQERVRSLRYGRNVMTVLGSL